MFLDNFLVRLAVGIGEQLRKKLLCIFAGRVESCFWWCSQIIDLDIKILIYLWCYGTFSGYVNYFLKHKSQCSFTINDKKNVLSAYTSLKQHDGYCKSEHTT